MAFAQLRVDNFSQPRWKVKQFPVRNSHLPERRKRSRVALMTHDDDGVGRKGSQGERASERAQYLCVI